MIFKQQLFLGKASCMHHVVARGIIKPPLDNGFCQPPLAISADASRPATQRGYGCARSAFWKVLVLVHMRRLFRLPEEC